MVVTTNMDEFISNYHSRKYVSKVRIHAEKLITKTQRHTDTSWGVGKGHYDKGDFDSEELAIEYAIRNKYKQILQSPRGTKYWFRHPRKGHKSYEDIINGLEYLEGCTTWTIKY